MTVQAATMAIPLEETVAAVESVAWDPKIGDLAARVKVGLQDGLAAGRIGPDRVVEVYLARILYSHDGSIVDGACGLVVLPETTEEVSACMRMAHAAGVEVTPRGSGTGLTGGAVPLDGGWVLAFEGFGGIEEVSTADSLAVVRPGTVLADVYRAVEAAGPQAGFAEGQSSTDYTKFAQDVTTQGDGERQMMWAHSGQGSCMCHIAYPSRAQHCIFGLER